MSMDDMNRAPINVNRRSGEVVRDADGNEYIRVRRKSKHGHTRSSRSSRSERKGRKKSSRSRYHGSSRRHRSGAGKVVLAVVGVVLLVLVVFAGALGLSAKNSIDLARDAASTARASVSAVKAGDAEKFQKQSSLLQEKLSALESEMQGPQWKIAARIPIIGDDVSAVRQTAFMANRLLPDILPALQDAQWDSNGVPLVTSGGVNGAMVGALCNAVLQDRPSETISHYAYMFGQMGPMHFDQTKELYDTVTQVLWWANDAVRNGGFSTIKDALGCQGARHYLVIAQQNAEIRSTGGFMGAFIPVTVENGAFEFGDVLSYQGNRALDYAPQKLTDEENLLFQNKLGNAAGMAERSKDYNFDPDFSRVASMFAGVWEQDGRGYLDGIIGVDVIMFQGMMQLVTNVVEADGEMVKTSDLARFLSNDVYVKYKNNSDQDDAFAKIFNECLHVFFDKVGGVDTKDLVAFALKCADEADFMLWMNDATEQSYLDSQRLTHSNTTANTRATLGVYLDNVTWGKPDAYLNSHTRVGVRQQNADGSVTYHVTTTLKNTMASAEAASQLPPTVAGVNKEYKIDASDILLMVYLYAPYGGTITDLQVSTVDDSQWKGEARHNGLQVFYGFTHTLAGGETKFTYNVTVPAEDADKPLRIRQSNTVG